MNKLEQNGQVTSHLLNPEGRVVVSGACRVTGNLYITQPFPEEELKMWLDGALAQNALKTLGEDDREFLISGTSPLGWKKLFPNGAE